MFLLVISFWSLVRWRVQESGMEGVERHYLLFPGPSRARPIDALGLI